MEVCVRNLCVSVVLYSTCKWQIPHARRPAKCLQTKFIKPQYRDPKATQAGNATDIQGVPLATEPGNEDIVTKFEQEYVRCVRNEEECVCSVCL